MKKLKEGFTQYNVDDLIRLGTTAGPAIAVIAFFAGITPTPATIATQTTDLINKNAATGPGSKQAMYASMVVLAGSLSLLASNINHLPGITETIMAETTLPMTKERTPTTSEPDAPLDLRLKNGQVSGAIRGRCKLTSPNIKMLELQRPLDGRRTHPQLDEHHPRGPAPRQRCLCARRGPQRHRPRQLERLRHHHGDLTTHLCGAVGAVPI